MSDTDSSRAAGSVAVDCGECTPFFDYLRRYYAALLDRYGFTYRQCSADHGGRECVVMYAGQRCNLLFVLTDGAEACAMGAPGTPFPADGWSGVDGEGGWYSIVGLIEFQSGQKRLTRRLIDEFVDGTRVYFEWEAALLGEWTDRLMALFEPGKQHDWTDRYSAFSRTRRYG